jgi:replicative DNA helicase
MSKDAPLLPSNVEAEQAVLGSILLDPAAYSRIDLQAREFHFEKNATIYKAMAAIHKRGDLPEFVTVCAELTGQQKLEFVGGASYLTALLGGMPTANLIDQYADIVRRDRIRREIIEAATHILHMGYNGENVATADLLSQCIGKLRAIDSIERGDVVTLKQAIDEFMPRLETFLMEQRTVWGIPTGFDIDKYLGGLQKTHLWILAGYPGKGKTAFALNLLDKVAQSGQAGILFSLEMSREELLLRLSSAYGHTNNEDIKRGKLTADQHGMIVHGMGEAYDAPMYIVEKSQTTESIRAHVARLKDSGVDLKLVVIDYLRLLRDRGEEPQRTNNITAECKNIAKDYDLTVLLVQSLNRRGDSETEPTLQSLLQGGDYDADVVMFTHFLKTRTNDEAKIIIEKHRHGRSGDVPMIYQGTTTSWQNPTDKNTPEPRYNFSKPVPTWDDAPPVEDREYV